MRVISRWVLTPPGQQKSRQLNQTIAEKAKPQVYRRAQVQQRTVARRGRKMRRKQDVKQIAGQYCGGVFQPAGGGFFHKGEWAKRSRRRQNSRPGSLSAGRPALQSAARRLQDHICYSRRRKRDAPSHAAPFPAGLRASLLCRAFRARIVSAAHSARPSIFSPISLPSGRLIPRLTAIMADWRFHEPTRPDP